VKSGYFTKDTIYQKSQELLNNLINKKSNRKIEFLPEQSALLILDMQRYFLDKSSHAFIPGAHCIIPKIRTLALLYTAKNLPVIITRHINTEENAGLMTVWWKDMISEQNVMSEIIPELVFPSSEIIIKSQYDAFYKTNLETLLKAHHVKQVVITGVMTHLCCESTVRSAFVRGLAVFFPVNGTATYNEELHKASFLNLSHGCAVPVLVEELYKKLEEKS